jgi:hypothetical protein
MDNPQDQEDHDGTEHQGFVSANQKIPGKRKDTKGKGGKGKGGKGKGTTKGKSSKGKDSSGSYKRPRDEIQQGKLAIKKTPKAHPTDLSLESRPTQTDLTWVPSFRQLARLSRVQYDQILSGDSREQVSRHCTRFMFVVTLVNLNVFNMFVCSCVIRSSLSSLSFTSFGRAGFFPSSTRETRFSGILTSLQIGFSSGPSAPIFMIGFRTLRILLVRILRACTSIFLVLLLLMMLASFTTMVSMHSCLIFQLCSSTSSLLSG